MTKISTDDVRALAQLSALRLDDGEAERYASDIERILEYFELLNTLDTDSVEPTYYGMDLVSVAREDVVAVDKVAGGKLIQLSQGGVVADQVKVPKVL